MINPTGRDPVTCYCSLQLLTVRTDSFYLLQVNTPVSAANNFEVQRAPSNSISLKEDKAGPKTPADSKNFFNFLNVNGNGNNGSAPQTPRSKKDDATSLLSPNYKEAKVFKSINFFVT